MFNLPEPQASVGMLLALNHSGGRHIVARRRAANRVARKARPTRRSR